MQNLGEEEQLFYDNLYSHSRVRFKAILHSGRSNGDKYMEVFELILRLRQV